MAERARIYSNGGFVVGSPTGGNKGAGTINASAVYDDNALLTDYVFEPGYTAMPLSELGGFLEREQHLPTMISMEEWKENRPSLGKLATQLWETLEVNTLYLLELEGRVRALEGAQ